MKHGFLANGPRNRGSFSDVSCVSWSFSLIFTSCECQMVLNMVHNMVLKIASYQMFFLDVLKKT